MQRAAAFRRTAIVAGPLAVATLQRLGHTWGATVLERHSHLPGDEIVPEARLLTDHAITIRAPAEEVWPWIVQVGWHRGGWYTYRWVDRLLFPTRTPSANEILPEHQDLRVGDIIPDGPPGTAFFVVDKLEPYKLLVLHSTSHMPPPLLGKSGNWIDWTWSFRVRELRKGGTRVQFRLRGSVGPRSLRLAYQSFVVPADFVMARSMLYGLKRRVERSLSATSASEAARARGRT